MGPIQKCVKVDVVVVVVVVVPLSHFYKRPPSRKYDTTDRGSLQSCRAEVMWWCCLRSCQSGHSRRMCVIVWGAPWQDGQVSEFD